jgi:hypothetical protein
MLGADSRSTKEFAHQKDTKAPEGTTAGVTAGGVIGGSLGVLVGICIPEYEAKRYEGQVKDVNHSMAPLASSTVNLWAGSR